MSNTPNTQKILMKLSNILRLMGKMLDGKNTRKSNTHNHESTAEK